LYVLAAREIFQKLNPKNNLSGNNNLSLYVSCFEIYGGKLYDLLNDRNTIKCLEDAKHEVQLLGLSDFEVKDVSELLALMAKAHTLRSIGSTG
jgi:kinesin family protein 2/24